MTAIVTLERAAAAGRVLDFSTCCINQDCDTVLAGEARVLLPRKRRESVPVEQLDS